MEACGYDEAMEKLMPTIQTAAPPFSEGEPTGASDGSTIAGELTSRWDRFRMQMRLLRSALKAWSPGAELDLQLKELLFDCLSLYTIPSDISSLQSVAMSFLIPETHQRYKNGGGQSVSLEPVFKWLGGWRPTSALVLVYSVLGYDSEGKRSTSTISHPQASELSDKQLSRMSNLQNHTQQAEDELSHQFATFQMLLVDEAMVKAVILKVAAKRSDSSEAHDIFQSKVETLLVLSKHAERLRTQTLQELFNLLTPMQAARCSIAAFELAFLLKNLSTSSLSSNRGLQTNGAQNP